jgi:hypothetical protein
MFLFLPDFNQLQITVAISRSSSCISTIGGGSSSSSSSSSSAINVSILEGSLIFRP